MTVGLFITGTDTDVGKTWVTSAIARQLRAQSVRVGVYKPVCSGAEEAADGNLHWHDIDELAEATGNEFDETRICPQRFRHPLAPPVAARYEGKNVDADLLRSGVAWWAGQVDILLVEGVGGLLCPLTATSSIADLATDLKFPLLVVARANLGTINHTLMTLDVAERRGLAVAGVILNEVEAAGHDPSITTNAAEIARRTTVPVLGVMPHGRQELVLRENRTPDWMQLAR